jgi:tetratricopeptide (TPR) repeat protein
MGKVVFCFVLLGALLALLLSACAPSKPPDEAVKEYMRGEDFYLRGQVEAAEAIFHRLAGRYHSFFQAHFMDAKSLYLLHREAEAEAELTSLVRDYPEYHEAEIWLVRIQVERRELDAAQVRLARLLSFDSQDPRLLYLMSEVRNDQGKLQESITYLNKAAAYEEEMARVHLDLGRLYYRFGLDGKAVGELNRVLILLPAESPLRAPVKELLTRVQSKER